MKTTKDLRHIIRVLNNCLDIDGIMILKYRENEGKGEG